MTEKRPEPINPFAADKAVLADIVKAARLNGEPPHADQAVLDRPLPPVHLWNPPDCGPMDLVIRADGQWIHEGRPIVRPALVRLFSTLLRRDGESYFLVTPVEKLRISVEDLPFRAVDVTSDDTGLSFTTDQGDRVRPQSAADLWLGDGPDGQPDPKVRVRADLWARLTRPVYYALAERAEAGEGGFGLWLRPGEWVAFGGTDTPGSAD
ncbi:MAG: DUF1285 domain-containing protein [Asticcacaulis sp.]